DGPAVSRMREQTLAEIRRAYESVEEVARDTPRFSAEKQEVPVLYDLLKVRGDGRTWVTTAWLWSSRDHFIKIRISAPSLDDLDTMREVAAAVVRLAEPKPDAPKRRPRGVVQLESSLKQSEREAWLLYGLGILAWTVKCASLETARPGPFLPPFAAE